MIQQEAGRRTSRRGSHRRAPAPRRKRPRALAIGIVAAVALVIGAVAVVAVGKITARDRAATEHPVLYVGLYQRDAPASYQGVTHFAQAVGRQPDLVSYYSSWGEAFQTGFADAASRHRATVLVQINPEHVTLAAIAAGTFDSYLTSYADAVSSYHHAVIMSFGHEMNGSWYSWGYQHTAPQTFVAAWRHIVSLFRSQGATNVTWMWTVNVINLRAHNTIPSPAAWWPGRSYVNWVGIDGYYHEASWTFAPLFGPTIKAVRTLTRDPILIAETGAAPEAGKPVKIEDLFDGIRAYGLLGFVWFDADGYKDWRINTPAAIAAFRRAAATAYMRPAPSARRPAP